MFTSKLTFDPKIIPSKSDTPLIKVHRYNFPLVIVIEELAEFLEDLKENYKPRKYKRSRFNKNNRKKDLEQMRKHRAAARLMLNYFLNALIRSDA